METYSGTLPDGWTQNDGAFAARAAGLAFDGVNVTGATITLMCRAAQPAATVGAWQAALTGPPPATPARIADDIDAALAAAMTRLAAIIDAPAPSSGTLTAAQLSDAVRALSGAVKDLARVQRRTLRVVRGDLDGTA